MATNKKNKSRVSKGKTTKKTSKVLPILIGVITIGVVAVAGILIYRSSQAASPKGAGFWEAMVISFDEEKFGDTERDNIVIRDDKTAVHYHFWYDNKRGDGSKLWWSFGSGRCVTITQSDDFKGTLRGSKNYKFGQAVTVWEQDSKQCYERTKEYTPDL